MLDYSDKYTINIMKVKYQGGFTHWEVEAFHNEKMVISGTAPTFDGVLDMAIQYGPDKWMNDDANNT